MTKSMKAVRDRKTDNRRISQNMEKAFKKMAQVFGYPNREYKDRVFRMLLKEPSSTGSLQRYEWNFVR